ncbi:MAG: putative transposase [Actinomycetota bacterium]|nr:putative transposase [Actinomycetota bacterium]
MAGSLKEEEFFNNLGKMANRCSFLSVVIPTMVAMVTTVHRTARIPIRATKAQRRRCLGLLRSAGDVRAMVIDCNRQLREWKLDAVVTYQGLCREVAGMSFGELDMVGIRSVLRRYSSEWFEAAKRRKAGEVAGFPRRKKGLLPVRWYHGTFSIGSDRLRIPTARGVPPLVVRLGRQIPYPEDSIRCVTLVFEAGRLYVDVTAELAVEDYDLDPGIIAGVDPGIIHPFAVMGPAHALLVSGRGMRAECYLHLSDTKSRAKKRAGKVPKKGQRGSRRWRKQRRSERKAQARHCRRINQAHHEAAKHVVTWAVEHRVGTLLVGDPAGICKQDAGARQNLRLRNWRRTHLIGALKDKAALAGIRLVEVNERGTSSTCPLCHVKVPKPRGRVFTCWHCGFIGHRDLVGAANIAVKGGGVICANPRIEHRRVGAPPTRRDRRRHLHDARRSCLAHGRPESKGSGSRSSRRTEQKACPSGIGAHAGGPALGEDPHICVLSQEGAG